MPNFKEDINEYYQKQKEIISKKYNTENQYNYKFSKKNTKDYIELYNGTELVMKAEYELMGIYNIFNSVWYWAYNIEAVDRNLTKESEKIKEFSTSLLKNIKDYDKIEAEYYRFLSNNGNFFISSSKIMRIIKFMLYVTKGEWFIPLCEGKDNVTCTTDKIKKDGTIKRIEYIMIKKITYF